MFHFDLVNVGGARGLFNWSREENLERGEKPTNVQLQIFPSQTPSPHLEKGFLADQSQKKTRFNNIIRALIYHKHKRLRFSGSSASPAFVWGVPVELRWWCLHGGGRSGEQTVQEKETGIPNLLHQESWLVAQIHPERRVWDDQAWAFFTSSLPFPPPATFQIPLKFHFEDYNTEWVFENICKDADAGSRSNIYQSLPPKKFIYQIQTLPGPLAWWKKVILNCTGI